MNWIKCSEKLPNVGDFVIGTDGFNVHEVLFVKEDMWFNCCSYIRRHDWNVIAWMRFPEPPKE